MSVSQWAYYFKRILGCNKHPLWKETLEQRRSIFPTSILQPFFLLLFYLYDQPEAWLISPKQEPSIIKVAFLPSSWGFLVFTWDSWWAFYKLYQAVLKWVRIAHYLSQSRVTVFLRFKIKIQIYFLSQIMSSHVIQHSISEVLQ